MPHEMAPLKNWCMQILGADHNSTAFRRVNEPFDNLPFLLSVTQTFGGQVNLQTMQVIDMPILTFEALAFTALAVSHSVANCHVIICVWNSERRGLDVQMAEGIGLKQ
eukprot:scaffold169907_cov31-Tisochrysis_lutea.AAC.1